MPASLQRPLTVAIDVSALVAGKAVSLYFDLLGFGARGSQVVLDNVRFVDVLNRPPQATDDTASASEDGGPVLINVLANDSDPDNDPLAISVAQTSAAGAVLAVVDGKVQYDPGMLFQSLQAGETATDTFTYTITDPSGDSA